jgi:hypothetical protein
MNPVDPSRYKQVEDEYFVLRGKLETKRINREQFEAALKELMVQDAQGRWWMLQPDSGRWYVHEGQSWVEANPYPGANQAASAAPRPTTLPESGQSIAVAPLPAPKTRGIGYGRIITCGCLALILLLLVGGGGGYLAYQNGMITPATLLNLAGMGPALIEVNNFRDDAIQVTIRQMDAPKDSTPISSGLNLNAFDVNSHRVENPGRYRVEFRATRGGTDLGNCVLTIRSGDQYQFVATPERLIVNRANSPASVGTDLIVATSNFCR